jgi:hypothetical protein
LQIGHRLFDPMNMAMSDSRASAQLSMNALSLFAARRKGGTVANAFSSSPSTSGSGSTSGSFRRPGGSMPGR